VARLSASAYHELRSQILSGQYSHGEHLAEEEIAEALGISRTPVREALRRLAAEGLVEVTPNRGANVAQWSTEELREIFTLRAMLESYAVERAVVRATREDLIQLEIICERMEAVVAKPKSAKSYTAIAQVNRDFHGALAALADSPRLNALIESLTLVPVVLQTFRKYSPEALARSSRHHREILDAMKARDGAWASSVMRAHILAARDEVIPPNE